MKGVLADFIANWGDSPYLDSLVNRSPDWEHPWISNVGVYMKPFCNQCDTFLWIYGLTSYHFPGVDLIVYNAPRTRRIASSRSVARESAGGAVNNKLA
jgi:hypothetical protein